MTTHTELDPPTATCANCNRPIVQASTAWHDPLSPRPFVCLSSVEAGMPHTPKEKSHA